MRLHLRFTPLTFICAGVLLLSALLPLPSHGAILGLPSPCPFFNLTGLPCPGCGLTRSFVSLGHGHIGEALRWHPVGPLLFVTFMVMAGTAFFDLPFSPRQIQRFFVGTLLLFGLFWVLRLSGIFSLPLS